MQPGEDDLRRLYEGEGLSCREIGERFGVSPATGRLWLAKAGIERRQKPTEKYPGDEAIRRLYVDERKSLNQIAEEFDVAGAAVVSRWLRKAGVEARGAREATMLSGKYGVHSKSHRESLRRNAKVARSKVTAESRKKQGEKMKGRTAANKGQPWTPEFRAKQMAIRSAPEYREKIAAAHRGEKSRLWKGGKTPDSSLHGWRWRALRQQVYERDGWTCQECGQRCLNTRDSKLHPKLKIQAHHILPRRYGGSDALENLVTLCMSCHHMRERAYQHQEEPV